MKWEVDWSQPSTIRGAVTFAGAVIALVFISVGELEKSVAVMGLAKLVAGGLGVAIKD